MNRLKNCLAVVMAAGEAKRFGGRKLYRRLGDKRVIDYVLDELERAGLGQVVVVTQPGDDLGRPFLTIENPAFASGQSSSIRAGLTGAGDWAGVFFCPADQIFLQAGVLEAMAHKLKPGAIVVPRYQSKNSSPVLFSAGYIPELMALSGDQGGKALIRRYPESVIYYEVDNPWFGFDIDTAEDFAAALDQVRELSSKPASERDKLKP